MGYRTLADCIADLERTGQLVRIEEEIDPYLEAAEIQRRVYAARGPAVYYARVRGTPFPMVSNLFGTLDRLRYIFRDALSAVTRLVELKVDPSRAARRPWQYLPAARAALHMLPKRVRRGAALARNNDRPPAASDELAGRRRPFHNAARGVYRRPRCARLARIEPGNVPRAVGGQSVSCERGSGPALSNPSRHRRASRGGNPQR